MAPPRNHMLVAALDYAARGVPVLPLHHPIGRTRASRESGCSCRAPDCRSPGKHPFGELVPHWRADATTDHAVITDWWTRRPDANIGLATGVRFDVLDIDGPLGVAAMLRLAGGRQIASGGPLVRTGSGGWHYWMRPTGLGNPDPRDLDHVDWRGRGGYVVAPPSLHAHGTRYHFVRGPEHPLPKVPPVLRARLEPARRPPAQGATAPASAAEVGHAYAIAALAGECAQLEGTPPGRRNQRLYEASLRLYSLVAGGSLDQDVVEVRLLAAAMVCGLGDREIRATLQSAAKIAQQHPRSIPALQRSIGRPAGWKPTPAQRREQSRGQGRQR
jgi:hypothetical protein